MNKKIIEQRAAKILSAENISKPPIKAEVLAESYFGLDISWETLSRKDVAADITFAEKKIRMNELLADKFRENAGFWNFTVAHELGHWVLHRNLPIDERSPQNEREADIFATHLLMPENFVREEFAKLPRWLPAEMKLDFLAKKFCVSKKAMKIRLSQRELKLIYVDFDDYSCYRSKEEFWDRGGRQIKLF